MSQIGLSSMLTKLSHFSYLRSRCSQNSLRAFSTKYKLNEISKVLSSIVGETNVTTGQSAREQHGHDESYHRLGIPQIVVWPNSVGEVSEVAQLCSARRICMIPFGTGTGLEGGVSPVKDSVCVDLCNMNEILDLNTEDFDVTVRPGVTRKQLNYELRSTGLWFPVDPGADASLCGMAATGASGTNAVRYGTMKQNILNLEVVLADGTVIHTGGKKRRCKKSSAGYNLTELFVGSEGTLGFITSATLRLHGIPEKTMVAVSAFPSIMDAVNTAIQVLQCNIPIARIELLDSLTMGAINQYSNLDYQVNPTLFFEFHGTEGSTKEQVEQTAEISELNSGSDFKWATTQEEINQLWSARHNVLYAVQSLKPGSKVYSTDVCVPMSALPEAIQHSVSVIEEAGLTCGILGHVGDGNFHCLIALDANQIDSVKDAATSIGRKAIELGGTCTGEHGIGVGKKDLLRKEVGESGINVMTLIKDALDPLSLMNPDKIF